MKNIYENILCALVILSFIACNNDNITPDMPDTPEQPATGYRLTFDGGVGVENQTRAHWSDLQGSGNLLFNWDYTPAGEDGNEMVMAFYKEKFLASTTGNYHTYASIHRYSDPEKQQDNHYASFTTVEKYDRPLSSGYYEDCRVVALTPLRADNDTYIYSLESRVIANLPMPGTFEQNDDQEPDFLSNYMYMYADASITDGTAFLLFEHIPATFRFKITNKRPEPARINSVKVTVVDTEGVEQPVASQYVDVLAASDEDIELSYSTISYTEVTTNINASLATDEKYTAYALVLPMYGNAPLEGKKIRFTIDASNPDNEYLSFELDAETLANANHGEYNWVGGKSYTIRMSLNDVLTFEEISVADWTEMEVGGGVAEEIPNTFDATAMTPEQLNAAVTEALEYGHTEIYVTLAADADATMFSAITAALAATVDPTLDPWEMEGTIDLTISGAKKVFDSAFGMLEGYNENWRAGAVLKTLTLPDVIEIEDFGINFCPNLTSVSAPKCEVLGEGALAENYALTSVYMPAARIIGNSTGENYGPFCMCDNLTEISLPEATILGNSAFAACWNLKTLYLPKVTEIIGCDAFKACDNLEEITLGALTTVNNANAGTFRSVTTGNVALVLSADQKAMNYDSSTKIYTAGTDAFDFNTTSFIGYTFKSISKQE